MRRVGRRRGGSQCLRAGGAVALVGSLLLCFALAATTWADDPCAGQPDNDGDGLCDLVDNCTVVPNASQSDGDQDGYGDACDCDYSVSANGVCDGADLAALFARFGTGVPPTNCEFDHSPSGPIDGGDFAAFGAMYGGLPGPACGNAPGTPCVSPGAACAGGFFETIEVVGPVSR